MKTEKSKKHSFRLCLSVILALSLLMSGVSIFSGCNSAVGVKNAVNLLDHSKSNPPSISEMPKDAASLLSDITFQLLSKTLPTDKSNYLMSPVSFAYCLAMIANGARGESLAQLEEFFGMDMDTLNKTLYAFGNLLSTREKDNAKFRLANSLWLRNNDNALHIKEDYLQTVADWYSPDVFSAPFDDSTVKDINGWTAENTDGLIKELIDELDPDAVMCLINTFLFEDKWAEEYEKSDISERTFTNYDKSTTMVDMMYSQEGRYLSGYGAQGFAKCYKNTGCCFVGLLPDDPNTDIYEFATSLTGEKWQELWSSHVYPQDEAFYTVNVRVPVFDALTEINLNPAMKQLGVTNIFDSARADFSGMGYSDQGNLFLGTFKQKCKIIVDPNGTKAAAATIGIMDCESEIVGEIRNITLDRPFVYAIVDSATGVPFFIGIQSQIE